MEKMTRAQLIDLAKKYGLGFTKAHSEAQIRQEVLRAKNARERVPETITAEVNRKPGRPKKA